MRVSTGKVKLRKAGQSMAFTVPKTVSDSLVPYVGSEFECDFNDDSGKLEVCFTSLRPAHKFTIKIGGRPA